jgi:hypothetical protein
MKFEKRFNILSGFDFSLLDDPDFKEDSVREEIIVPIIKGLGYSHSKPNKIIRSKKLLHPFVSIGSVRKNIYIIPDYLFEVNDRYGWVLDAKSPSQEIIKTKHVEQAYSYAVHSEIRVPYFSICNGREFVLFHISEQEPVIHFDLRLIASYWDNLLKILSPNNVLNCDFSLSKDFGLHLKKLGFHEFESIVFPDVPIMFIARIEQELYTFGSGIKNEQDNYVASFDFNYDTMTKLKYRIPNAAFDILTSPFRNAIENVQFADRVYRVNVDCKVGDRLSENAKEIFLPFWVNNFLY